MPQRAVPFLPDHYYHFYNRGNNRQTVFFDRDSYLFFLHGMKKYLREYLDIIAYCLMPTHYHILARVRSFIQTSEELKVSEVSHAMQKFLISYTKATNKRFDRVGALFQGQFQAKLIEEVDHLLHLCAYIHANPVKDNLVSRPEAWEFSNYPEWMNLRHGTLFNRQFVEEFFGTREEYNSQVIEYIETRNIPEGVRKYLEHFED